MGSSSSDLSIPRAGATPDAAGNQQMYAAVTGPTVQQARNGARPPAAPKTVVQKTKMIRNPCNVHKDSLRLVPAATSPARYHLQFRYDSEVPCDAYVCLMAEEVMANGRLSYHPRLMPREQWAVGPVPVPAGTNQCFSTASCTVAPNSSQNTDYGTDELRRGEEGGEQHAGRPFEGFDLASLGYAQFIGPLNPVAVMLSPERKANQEVDDAGRSAGVEVRCQVTLAEVERKGSSYHVKSVKQKLETTEGIFALQEIYGISAQASTDQMATVPLDAEAQAPAGEGGAGKGSSSSNVSSAECVVCLTNKRELAVLPCRHMCMCRFCAAECVRSQDAKCPICRTKIQAMLKLTYDDTERQTESSVL